jgi:hypothetical protein
VQPVSFIGIADVLTGRAEVFAGGTYAGGVEVTTGAKVDDLAGGTYTGAVDVTTGATEDLAGGTYDAKATDAITDKITEAFITDNLEDVYEMF